MGIEELAAMVMGEISWISGLVIFLIILFIFGFAILFYKLEKQQEEIEYLSFSLQTYKRQLKKYKD